MSEKMDIGMPMVSVVMIAYNNAPTLPDAIEGVLGQKVSFPIELIINDDASTDATPEIIARYAERFPDVVKPFRHDENVGIQRNYLSAFPRCRGRYMAMCDADDYWFCPTKLARQVEYMEAHKDCAVTFHRVVNLYLPSGEMSLSGRPVRTDMTIVDLAKSNIITNMSVMYRRELVDLTRLPEWMKDIKLLDYAMHMQYAAKGYIHFFNRPMGVYRQWAEGAWSRTSQDKKLRMSLKVRECLMEQFANEPRVMDGLLQSSERIAASIEHPVPPSRPRLLTRLRRIVSRCLPAPRPPRLR